MKQDTPFRTVSFRISQDLAEQLEDICRSQRRPISSILRLIVEDFINLSEEERRTRLGNIIG